jgi:hypothetical protein
MMKHLKSMTKIGQLSGVSDSRRYAKLLEAAYRKEGWRWYARAETFSRLPLKEIPNAEVIFSAIEELRGTGEDCACGGLGIQNHNGSLFLWVDATLAKRLEKGEASTDPLTSSSDPT